MPRKTKDVETTEIKPKVSKKASTTNSKSKKTTTKKATTKNAVDKKTATKKTTKKSKTSPKKAAKYINEYYDLPYRYNQTIVKILAQTPKKLFVYWDISDKDKKKMLKQYGDKFFEVTKPVLIVHNITLDYYFQEEINDFANSWYLNIDDAKCEYSIELGRMPIPVEYLPANLKDEQKNDLPEYIYISSSNKLEAPNNRVLYESLFNRKIIFRSVKTNETIEKDIMDFEFILKLKSIANLYKKFYTSEDLYYINNPSSGLPSSRINSSQFK